MFVWSTSRSLFREVHGDPMVSVAMQQTVHATVHPQWAAMTLAETSRQGSHAKLY